MSTTRRTTELPAGPIRLAEQAPSGDPTVDRASQLLAELQAPPRLHPAVDARIDRRLAGLARPAARRRARWPVFAASSVALLLGGAVAAKYNPAPLRRLMEVLLPAPEVPAPVRRRRAPEPALVPPSVPAPRPASESAPRPRIVLRTPVRIDPAPPSRHEPPQPAPAPAPAAAPAPPEQPAAPAPPPSALAGESTMLGRALAQLRRDEDPGAALATLDEYEARFPRGVMAFDAIAARVEALVKLGRRDAALARLDDVPAAALAKSPGLRVVRGELRAGAGRLDAAIADFDQELGRRGAARGDLFERALYGRGSCRARRGDGAGAREDLERYLSLYPQGRFAAEARQVLGR
jgi:hypothetical protein